MKINNIEKLEENESSSYISNQYKKNISIILKEFKEKFINASNIEVLEEFYIGNLLFYKVLVEDVLEKFIFDVNISSVNRIKFKMNSDKDWVDAITGEITDVAKKIIKNDLKKEDLLSWEDICDNEKYFNLLNKNKMGLLKESLGNEVFDLICNEIGRVILIKNTFVEKEDDEGNRYFIETEQGYFSFTNVESFVYEKKMTNLIIDDNNDGYYHVHQAPTIFYSMSRSSRYILYHNEKNFKKSKIKESKNLHSSYVFSAKDMNGNLYEKKSTFGQFSVEKSKVQKGTFSLKQIFSKEDLVYSIKSFIEDLFREGCLKKENLYRNENYNKEKLVSNHEKIKRLNNYISSFMNLNLKMNDHYDNKESVLHALNYNEIIFMEKKKKYEGILFLLNDIKNEEKLSSELKAICNENFSKIDEIYNIDQNNLLILKEYYDLFSQKIVNERLSKLLKFEEENLKIRGNLLENNKNKLVKKREARKNIRKKALK
jgi:hypothetical protein